MSSYDVDESSVDALVPTFDRWMNRGLTVVIGFFSSLIVLFIDQGPATVEIFVIIVLSLLMWRMLGHFFVAYLHRHWRHAPQLWRLVAMVISVVTMTLMFIASQQAINFVRDAWVNGNLNTGESIVLIFVIIVGSLAVYRHHAETSHLPETPGAAQPKRAPKAKQTA